MSPLLTTRSPQKRLNYLVIKTCAVNFLFKNKFFSYVRHTYFSLGYFSKNQLVVKFVYLFFALKVSNDSKSFQKFNDVHFVKFAMMSCCISVNTNSFWSVLENKFSRTFLQPRRLLNIL